MAIKARTHEKDSRQSRRQSRRSNHRAVTAVAPQRHNTDWETIEVSNNPAPTVFVLDDTHTAPTPRLSNSQRTHNAPSPKWTESPTPQQSEPVSTNRDDACFVCMARKHELLKCPYSNGKTTDPEQLAMVRENNVQRLRGEGYFNNSWHGRRNNSPNHVNQTDRRTGPQTGHQNNQQEQGNANQQDNRNDNGATNRRQQGN